MTNDFITNKKQAFDLWAPSYDWLLPSVFYQSIHKRLLEYVDLPPQPHVLDLGCGTGRLLDRLAAKFPDLWGTGLDLSQKMVRVARQSNRHRPRLIFVEGKAESLPFADGQFNAVFNTISFLHYLEPKQIFSEVSRVLSPDGRFYLVDTTAKSQPELNVTLGALGKVKFYSPQQRELMGATAGLACVGHYYLLGPVLLTIFAKPV
ncbi:class I SAM-dependent methyltransferase [Tolypothrix sp. FACHB-123]|uniref:class I SAM-dependent methyltransferase n=1 Tax=Tolypothrix sp. FACHB-123 TaxID=2692868 RepID=UPI001688EF2A|nr:class I SAM-dependent methyltransferase [Tolypothrix sp. FACHB-123]MBD2357093.1 class I SAM-dependent methyltransferase [Tolypothrix sp. FACHB-123]